jgi:PAS domain S-box-containing protein
MKADKDNSRGTYLRKVAEEQLALKNPDSICKAGATDEQKLIQELQIHQIELQMQNEELIAARQAADELRQEYQTLFTIAPVGYLVIGQNSMIIRCNDRAAEMFGTTPDHMEGRRLAVFLDQTTLAAFSMFYQDCCSKKTGPPCEFFSRSGHTLLSDPRHLHFFGQRIQTKTDPDHCIVAISDETELHQYQGALRETNRKLHLLSNITRHDVLNQVTVLAGSLELIRMKREEGMPIDVDFARCESAKKTIHRLIMFTHEYTHLGVEKPAWQSARAAVEKVCQTTTLPVSVDPSLDSIEVYADMMLSSLFSNLFENAEEHGRHASRISVSFHQNGREGIIVVEDDGIGVPNDMKNQIFTRGFGEGTGLGLFFCSEILAITGISICETGTPGEGVRFELRIPVGVWRSQEESP